MLAQRLLTAAIGIPIILAVVLLGGPLYTLVAAAILAIAAVELVAALDPYPGRSLWQPRPTALVAAAGVVATVIAADNGFEAPGLVLLGAGGLAGLITIARSDRTGASREWLVVLATVAYVGLLGSNLVTLRELDDDGHWLLLALLATWLTDTAAYAVGKLIGRHKMAPKLSPGKTWEGTIGGLVGGLAAVVALNWPLDLPMDYGEAAVLGLVLPIVAVLADLGESALKRGAGVKDTSELVPGHGGLLDRLDSLLFTLPVVYYFATWVVV